MLATFKDVVRPLYWFVRRWRYQVIRAQALWSNGRAMLRYQRQTFEQFRASRRSQTLFILGSGYSVNAISPSEWAHMAAHNTLSFNRFIHQDFVRADYHIMRELAPYETFQRAFWQPELEAYAEVLEANPHYAETMLLMQAGWMAIAANRLIGLGCLKAGRKILRYRNRPQNDDHSLPDGRFEDGIVHHLGTLSDAIHLGYLGGWTHLVLVGVDLYDRRSFWLPPDDLRRDYQQGNATIETPHNTALTGIIPFLQRWQAYLAQQGVRLWVYNPRSLLAEFMPVYSTETIPNNE
jgi:hypothetical protein